MFRSQMWGVEYGEKWEYQNTTPLPGGHTIAMKVTTKCLGNQPVCQTPASVVTKQFAVTGSRATLDGITIVDFSLQTGDTTVSPFYYGGSGFSPYCDSLSRFPATVTQSGTETVNGISGRYYVIRYLSGIMNQTDSLWGTRKFTEYNWIDAGYWWFADSWVLAPEHCPVVDPYVLRDLYCYYDDLQPAMCDMTWFDQMDVNENDISALTKIFPNPATDQLNITLPESDGNWTFKIISADGKQLSNGSLVGNRVDLATLGAGIYFLVLENGAKSGRFTFVKQ